MRFNDAIAGCALVLFASLVLWHARGFPPMPGQEFGPALFPSLISLGLIAAGVGLVLVGVRKWKAAPVVQIAEGLRDPRLALNFAVVVGGILFYIVFSERLGFLIAAPLVLFAILLALRTRWYVALPVAVVVVLFMHEIFYGLLKVPLPWGVLTPYAW
jgi:putative tricarboxylic transport membrane protein